MPKQTTRWIIILTIAGSMTLAFGLLLKFPQRPVKYDLGSPVILFGCLLLLIALCLRITSRS